MAANPGVIGLSQAAIEEKWARLVARGGELLTHMRNDKDTSQQSPFLDPKQDFTRHGWTRLVFPQTNYATAHSAQLHNLRGVEGLATASSISTVNCMNQRWWHAINAVQDRPSFVNTQSHEPKLPTGRSYRIVCNTGARVLTWFENPEPRQSAPSTLTRDLPELFDFSDVGFLAYCASRREVERRGLECYGNATNVLLPSWFHVPYIQHSAKTLSTITAITQRLGNQSYFPFRPITLPLGSEYYNAMLATPLVAEFARLLIRYKHIMGTSLVTSITIYNSWALKPDLQISQSAPGLLVHAASSELQLDRIRSENQSYERNAPFVQCDWPHKLRPTLYAGPRGKTVRFWLPEPPPDQLSLNFASSTQQGSSSTHEPHDTSQIEQAANATGSNFTGLPVSLGLLTDAEARSSPFLEPGLGLFRAMLGVESNVPAQILTSSVTTARQHHWNIVQTKALDVKPLQFLHAYFGVENYQHVAERGVSTYKSAAVSLSAPGGKDECAEFTDTYEKAGVQITYHSLVSYRQQFVAQLKCDSPWPQGLVLDASVPKPETVPAVRDWGDLAVAEWMLLSRQRTTSKFKPPLWWAILTAGETQHVSPHAQMAIERFLDSQGLDKVPAWPGITLPVGSAAYLELLSTAEIRQIVRALNVRKESFGNALVTSITVFEPDQDDEEYGEDEDNIYRLHFLADVQRVKEEIITMSQANREFERMNAGLVFPPLDAARPKGPLTTKREPQWPFPLRPTRYAEDSSDQTHTNLGPAPGTDTGKGKGPSHGKKRFLPHNPFHRGSKS